jgi:hypothetical protein
VTICLAISVHVWKPDDISSAKLSREFPSATSAQVTLFALTGRILLLPSSIATRDDDACPFLYISNRTSLFDTENLRIKCLDS